MMKKFIFAMCFPILINGFTLINIIVSKNLYSYMLFFFIFIVSIILVDIIIRPIGVKYNPYLLSDNDRLTINGRTSNFSEVVNIYEPTLYTRIVDPNSLIAIYYKGALRGNML